MKKAKRKRYMSERKAWLFLADLWKKAKRSSLRGWIAVDAQEGGLFFGYGLCDIIDDMVKTRNRIISDNIRKRMMAKIEAKARRHPDYESYHDEAFYLWELDEKGKQSRVRFRLAQAKKLERKKK